ncbi:hypothetical protein [Desulfuromonas sp. AOP6]|uniref:hypothetical protein n=1 Tax=Desulfuromonas sp. AOP6 TaxID=1566351 RepID=UPI00128A52A1|nr:hypothetical protein [Desulfuromonas sp. AOP6]BCA78574.1 hypothetical protein AOP6_0361 [Desulfuromonas sp. AOP6]BCA80947.1 hypothetical protein AOP6_2734 [Desulfuromonas sp. AOP6]
MELSTAITLMIIAAYFGFSGLYFLNYLRKEEVVEFNSIQLLVSFAGNVSNIPKFYKAFYQAHEEKHKKAITASMLWLHLACPVLFWVVVAIEAA